MTFRKDLDLFAESKPSLEERSPSSSKRKSPSASPPIQTNSRFTRNPSLLGLNEADQIIRKHSEEVPSPDNSGRSIASTVVTTPTQQTITPPYSPLTDQSSPTSSLTGITQSPSLLSILPILGPPKLISMPDNAGIIAALDETNVITKIAQNNLVSDILKAYPLNDTFLGDHKTYIEGLVTHIWEENLEILSLARYQCHVGIYYTHGINKTVQVTGRSVHLQGFFKPDNVSFLTEYGKHATFNVPSLKELNPKIENTSKAFDFSDAIIFLPICYTAKHAVKKDEFFEAMKSFVFEKKCPIMIYVGRDGGLEENRVKRQDWLAENQTYIQQIKEMYPEFWKKNHDKITITITYRDELIKMPQYLYAEYYFAHYLANESAICEAIKKDVCDRLIQKKYFTPPTKAVNIMPRQSLPAPVPQLSTSPLQLAPRPHSYPSSDKSGLKKLFMPPPESGRVSPSDQLLARQIIENVRQSSGDQIDTFSEIAREAINRKSKKHNPFASIFNNSPAINSLPLPSPESMSSDDEDTDDDEKLYDAPQFGP